MHRRTPAARLGAIVEAVPVRIDVLYCGRCTYGLGHIEDHGEHMSRVQFVSESFRNGGKDLSLF